MFITDAKSEAINIDKEAEDFLAQHASCQAKCIHQNVSKNKHQIIKFVFSKEVPN